MLDAQMQCASLEEHPETAMALAIQVPYLLVSWLSSLILSWSGAHSAAKEASVDRRSERHDEICDLHVDRRAGYEVSRRR